MLASRLLSILMLLQTRGRMSAPELAQEFEVSVRTIYRDIDQLSAAGVPVYGDRGRSGGFHLVDGYRTKLTGLTAPEAETLFLAGLPGPAAELGLADLLATARLKLMAALPAGAQAERIAARFHLDPAGWFRAAEPAELLPEIARAVWNTRAINIRYRRAGEVHARNIRPLGLVLKAGNWYLVAQKAKEFRTYRVGNIAEVQTLDEVFDRPKGFDLIAYWTKSSRDFEENAYREHALVYLSPRGRRMLDWHLLGPYVAQSVAKTASAPDKDGWVRCTIPLESIDFGIRDLMRLGAEVEVLAPITLRKAMIKALSGMASLYRRAQRTPA